MAEPRHLNNAPIREAIINIRAEVNKEVLINSIEQIKQALSQTYPSAENIERKGFEIHQSNEEFKHTTIDEGIYGIRLTSKDEKYISNFACDGFSVSRLEPYEDWERFADEALRLWKIYIETLNPSEKTRVSSRFINEIVLPLPIVDFDEYFTAAPQQPEGLPQGISNFFTRTTFTHEEYQATANVVLTMGSNIEDTLPVILDIDVFKSLSGEITLEECFEELKKLRDFKNDIFFKSITEKTAGLYQ